MQFHKPIQPDEDINIYKWKSKCWKCSKEITKVSYFFASKYSSHTIGSVQKLDEILAKKYPFIQKVFSKTMGKEVIGNICVHCNAYQGNWFIAEELLLDLAYKDMHNYIDFRIPNTFSDDDFKNAF